MSSEQSPLLPQYIHRLGPAPVRFPSGTRPKDGGVPNQSRGEEEGRAPPQHHWAASLPPTYKSGIPKITRQCLLSECICYGKYIVAVIAVFGIGGVLLALWLSGRI
ncbi:hypothetical protein BDV93DRAFT_518666 [Ceratobasidium sp. AG-I]|nr:hypothetical protein BDV93DRAFT_518666 [Ceratobasidium sp. AG-I]